MEMEIVHYACSASVALCSFSVIFWANVIHYSKASAPIVIAVTAKTAMSKYKQVYEWKEKKNSEQLISLNKWKHFENRMKWEREKEREKKSKNPD